MKRDINWNWLDEEFNFSDNKKNNLEKWNKNFINNKPYIMEVFEVLSTNLDVNDGTFIRILCSNLISAINAAKIDLENKKASNVVEDFAGKLSEYDGKSLEYTACKNNPAIYYRNYYGNYRCVNYIKTRTVHN